MSDLRERVAQEMYGKSYAVISLVRRGSVERMIALFSPALGAVRTAAREAALNEAAYIACNGCLVPPDGGSPTTEEADMCAGIAKAILALKDTAS